MEDFDAVHVQILNETQNVADGYREKFSGSPAEELQAWLQVAVRREALVRHVYGESQRENRLPETRSEAAQVAWRTIHELWDDEAGHTDFLERQLKHGALALERPFATDLLIWMGAAEGTLMDALTQRPGLKSTVARVATQIGHYFAPERVPELALSFRELNPRDFFLLARTLESTARQSYERMLDLAGELYKVEDGSGVSVQFKKLALRLKRTLHDERFHENAFREMATWVTEAGAFHEGMSGKTCARNINRLLPRSARAAGDPDSPEVLTDGGLGKLFADYGIHVNVVTD